MNKKDKPEIQYIDPVSPEDNLRLQCFFVPDDNPDNILTSDHNGIASVMRGALIGDSCRANVGMPFFTSKGTPIYVTGREYRNLCFHKHLFRLPRKLKKKIKLRIGCDICSNNDLSFYYESYKTGKYYDL